MGQANIKERLYSAIEKGRRDRVSEIIERYPEVLNQELSKDVRVTPLARAVWRGDFEMTDLFVKLGAEIDNGGSSGITPLMWAAKRDNAYMVSNLIDFGANITLKSQEGFTALDYAIIHGNYRPALFLYDFFQETKEIMDYYRFAKEKDYRYVNYEIFMTHLKSKTDQRQVPNYFQKPEKKKLVDPVIDPREPWGKMISRIIEFEEPPLVERQDLPENLQPQNRFWGKVRSYANGIDPTPKIQKHEKEEVESLKFDQQSLPQSQQTPSKNQHQVIPANEESIIADDVNVNQISIQQ